MEQALEDLAVELANADPGARSATELADAAVFLAHAGQHLARPELATRSLELAAMAVERADGHAGLGLYDGLVGVAWAIEHMLAHPQPRHDSEPRGWSWDDDPTEDVHDVVLFETVDPEPRHAAELAYGRVGHGVLELERLLLSRRDSRRLLAAIADRLEGAALSTTHGVTWRAAASDADHYEDLGLAHGSAGVIAFLARLVRLGIAPHRTVPLLERATAQLSSHRLHDGGFPGRAYQGRPPVASRLAWCYGDLGVAAALWGAGTSLQRAEPSELAVDVAVRAAARDLASAGEPDAGFCHGAAGLAFTFQLLHHLMRAEPLRDAARRWLEHGLHLARPPADRAPWGMLEGLAGIGLAWVAAISPRPPHWASRFLLWPD
ncbi:lanthionine synthetase LanC family protein [Paraliomyxa miuraensis]|uniref:lanthionine synthetase LanC family protein n=1 Tax=Paraliomyxa miuraensis TaxID=376150 RepID=UPI0022595D34|nr:lanthionine synthetase LanC family protein [Paraliomyxa miuraensis]MCX4242636.1 hypothetical protein [Paraliomyxa miuraensis]